MFEVLNLITINQIKEARVLELVEEGKKGNTKREEKEGEEQRKREEQKQENVVEIKLNYNYYIKIIS